MMIRVTVAIALLIAAAPAPAREKLVHIPFVGCPADGQTGIVEAPKSGATPAVPTAAAARLAFYAGADGLGVLAPRGWHCVELYGASGAFVIVTPERYSADELFKEAPILGPAIQLSVSQAGTSGRLEVMPVIARYFPRYRAFIRDVKTWDSDIGPYPTRPYSTDIIRQRTPNSVRFTTPAGKKGEGTNSRLVPGNLQIEGVRKIIGPPEEPDLLGVDVRLPPRLRQLASIILSNAAK